MRNVILNFNYTSFFYLLLVVFLMTACNVNARQLASGSSNTHACRYALHKRYKHCCWHRDEGVAAIHCRTLRKRHELLEGAPRTGNVYWLECSSAAIDLGSKDITCPTWLPSLHEPELYTQQGQSDKCQELSHTVARSLDHRLSSRVSKN